MIDLGEFFDATILLISDDQLGCINNTLLNIALLESKNRRYTFCINKKSPTSDFERVSLPYFQARFDKLLSVQKDIEEIAKRLLRQ